MKKLALLFAIFLMFGCCKHKDNFQEEELRILQACSKVCGETVTNTGTASGGTPPYTYQWSGGLGSSTANPFVTTATAPGVYTVNLTITDANGCQDMLSNTITYSLPNVTLVSVPDLVCPDNINLNIYVAGSTNTPYTIYNGNQSGCNPTNPVSNPTNFALADGQNDFTVCNGNLGSGGTCCTCQSFTLWSTCDPANANYTVTQTSDDLCDDGQICFEVDLSPCEAPAGASWTETVTWTSTPNVSGTESDDGTTYQICYTQAQLAAAGVEHGDNLNVQVGLEITNSNTGSASCGDSNLDDIDVTIPCCTCNIVVDLSGLTSGLVAGEMAYLQEVHATECDGTAVTLYDLNAGDPGTLIIDSTPLVVCSHHDVLSAVGLPPVNQLTAGTHIQNEINSLCGAGTVGFFSVDGNELFVQVCGGCIETIQVVLGVATEDPICANSTITGTLSNSDTNAACCP